MLPYGTVLNYQSCMDNKGVFTYYVIIEGGGGQQMITPIYF